MFPSLSRTLEPVPILVLKLCCEQAIEIGSIDLVDSHAILPKAYDVGLSQDEVFDALQALYQRDYIKPYTLARGHIRHFAVTFDCFEEYARANIRNYDEIIEAVAYQLANEDMRECKALASALEQPPVVVEHFLYVLERTGLIRLEKSPNDLMVTFVSSHLKHIMGET